MPSGEHSGVKDKPTRRSHTVGNAAATEMEVSAGQRGRSSSATGTSQPTLAEADRDAALVAGVEITSCQVAEPTPLPETNVQVTTTLDTTRAHKDVGRRKINDDYFVKIFRAAKKKGNVLNEDDPTRMNHGFFGTLTYEEMIEAKTPKGPQWTGLAEASRVLLAAMSEVEEIVNRALPLTQKSYPERLQSIVRLSTDPKGLNLTERQYIEMEPRKLLQLFRDWERAQRSDGKGGRPTTAESRAVHARWVAMGRPALTNAFCDKLALLVYPGKLKGNRGSPEYKTAREGLRNAIRRLESKAAT